MKKCNYPDCFNCTKDDCDYERIDFSDIKRQDEFDKSLQVVEPEILKNREKQKRYQKSEKGKETQRRYVKSEKGKKAKDKYEKSDKRKESISRYNKSDKGKETRRKYLESENGKEMLARKQKKRIASGKNAEYCRNYYLRKKAEKELQKAN